MALKQLRLQKQLSFRKSALAGLTERDAELKKRSEELEAALEEAENDEDVKLVEEEAEKHEAELEKHEEDKKKLEEEISGIEAELEELEDKQPEGQGRSGSFQVAQTRKKSTIEVNTDMKINKHETRSQMLDRLNQPEVREFYAKVKEAVVNKRALGNADLVIPEVVLDRIQLMIGDYSNLINEVEVVDLTGKGRVIVDGAIPEAIWTEMCDEVQEMATAFDPVEVDGYKVGGFIPVCNAVLEDSMINLAQYVEDRIARAIGKALDKAILTGTGAAGKQPEGIIPAITADSVSSDFMLGDLLSNLGAIDTGEGEVGEIIAVMKRSTYYKQFMPQTVVNTADGRQVVQGVSNPNLAGLRVVFSQYMEEDEVLLGDFKQYLLARRAGVSITSSTDVRFIQDETVFKGTARYDGKPVKAEAFQLVTLAPAGA
ncbi:putative major capsid protein [Exiguobacterium phage vB_EauS-123]|nr:putative major capsid protein [Exiguobacterium phage vB_EauS-123]